MFAMDKSVGKNIADISELKPSKHKATQRQ